MAGDKGSDIFLAQRGKLAGIMASFSMIEPPPGFIGLLKQGGSTH